MQLGIFSQTKVAYLIDVIKKMQKTEDLQEDRLSLEDWFHTAKVTCEVLVANMVNPDCMNHIFFSYYKRVTPDNAIKLLHRCANLYEARVQAVKILTMVAEIDVYFLPKSQLSQLL